MPVELPPPGASNRRIVKRALILVALLSVPVIGLILLQLGVLAACSGETLASGVASNHLQWRITKMTCRNAAAAYYDVAIGAEGETMSTALTSQGQPIPLEVKRVDDTTAGIKLDRPRVATGEDVVKIKLRRSGSPSQRVDLQADVAPKK
jgi:hypothetical protein